MNYTEENAKLEKEIEYLELCIDTMYGPDVRRCWWGDENRFWQKYESRSDRLDNAVYEGRVSQAYNKYARLYNSAKMITDESARERWGYGPEYQTWENLDPAVREPMKRLITNC